MAVIPGRTPCLRCVFSEPPGPGELPTCDTAGVLGSVTAVVGSLQALAAIKLLSGNAAAVANEMAVLDLWSNSIKTISLDGGKRDDCPTCGLRRFDYLNLANGRGGRLCGRNAVQVVPSSTIAVDLSTIERRWAGAGPLFRTPYYLKLELVGREPAKLTLFPDGRLIVQGTEDVGRARSLYSRYVGS
jgi:adenylyltransferase/sulfurtransferase